MSLTLTSEQRADFARRGVSRRGFHQIAAMLAAGSAFPLFTERALAQRATDRVLEPGTVKIDANENPMGPIPEAAEAMRAIVQDGGRYLDDLTPKMVRAIAAMENLDPASVHAYPGSSDPLFRSVLAFCGKERPYVVADPSFEIGAHAAGIVGAPVINVPLVKGTFAHDVKAMAAAHPTPGIIYVCNPNNPTGTVTPKADIEWLVNNKPKDAVVLLDEAYIHFSSSAVMGSYLVAAGKDVIVLRTFSKIYGMAGLRAGAAMARPDLLRKINQFTSGFMPVTATTGAIVSLNSKTLIPERRKTVHDIREETLAFLASHKIETIPSEANMFMMNVKRPGREFANAMLNEKVAIGRTWPVMPTWVRVTVGTAAEMERFRAACIKCYTA